MAISTFADQHTAGIVREAWSDMFMKELRQNNLLVNLLDKSYQVDAPRAGDTVKISQINAPTGDLLTIGTDADTFSSEAISTSQVEVVINKVAIASYEFEDDALLLSQLGSQDSRPKLLFGAPEHKLVKPLIQPVSYTHLRAHET